MMSQENPLLYRFSQAERRLPGWKKLATLAIYPSLVLAPLVLSQLRDDSHGCVSHDEKFIYILALFLHFVYFCGRPLMSAVTSLAVEKQRGTFDCLATTGFTAGQWVQTLFQVCTLPRLFEVATLGWILAFLPMSRGGEVTFSILLYSATCVVVYGAAGLWISARSRSVAQAQLQAILLLCSTFFFVLAADVLLTETVLRTRNPFLCQYVSPFIVAGLHWHGNNDVGPYSWLFSSLGQLLLTFLLLKSTVGRVGAPQRAHSKPRRDSWLLKQLAAFATEPLMYRSLLQLSSDRTLILRLLAYPALLLSLRFVLPMFSQGHSQHRTLEAAFYLSVLGHIVYLTVRAAMAGSVAVAEERESRTWESLLSTRLSLTGVVTAQWVSRVLPVVIECLLWSFLWLAYSRPAGGYTSLHSLALMVIYSAVWTAFVGTLALWQSGRWSTAAQALRTTVALLFVAGLGTIIADSLIFGKMDYFALLSPVYGMAVVLQDYDYGKGIWSLVFYALATPVCFLLCWRALYRQELRFSR